MWLVVIVESSVPWIAQDTEVEFRGKKLFLRPETQELYPDISVEHTQGQWHEALQLVRQFMSNLSWWQGYGIKEVGTTGGGNRNTRRKKNPWTSVGGGMFDLSQVPDPADQESRLALAYYREGLTAPQLHYGFLSFFKVVNVKNDRGPDQEMWINQNIGLLTNRQAKESLNKIISIPNSSVQSNNIGKYLVERRHGVAHAQLTDRPVINPDDIELELFDLVNIVQGLAELFIEKELKVKSLKTWCNEKMSDSALNKFISHTALNAPPNKIGDNL